MDENKTIYKKIIKLAIVCAIAFLALLAIASLTEITAWFTSVFLIVRAVVFGLIIAYLLNPIFRLFERKLLNRIRCFALKRTLSLILTVVVLFLIIACLMVLILPKFIESLITFAKNYTHYVSSAIHHINLFLGDINGLLETVTGNPTTITYFNEQAIIDELFNSSARPSWIDTISSFNLKPITSMLSSTFSNLVDLVIGLFLAIYLLASKEKRYAQIMKVRRAIFGTAANERITRICTTADRAFGGFIKGKFIDSLIIGALLYAMLLLFRVPYATLIASVLAVFNMIPMVGILIGAIPAAMIVLLADPDKILPFLVLAFIVQHVDNNVITPKIVGNNIGVSPMCVLISISIFGTLWGFAGMFLAVPLTATLLELLEEFTVARLQKAGHPSGVESYYSSSAQLEFNQSSAAITDQSAQRLTRLAIASQKKADSGEKLTFKEHIVIIAFKVATKLGLHSELSDKTIIELSVQNVGRVAEQEAQCYLEEHSKVTKKKRRKPKTQVQSDAQETRKEPEHGTKDE